MLPHAPPPSEGFYHSIYGLSKKPRSFAQWVEAAQRNTEEVLKYGSTSPLVWVLVRGCDIPQNALIAGEERRQALYIARTFYEGITCIGKAGFHLKHGAVFVYNGREVHSRIYEVLALAFEPLRYSISDEYTLPHIPRIHRDDSATEQVTNESYYSGTAEPDYWTTVDSNRVQEKPWPVAQESTFGAVNLYSGSSGVPFCDESDITRNLNSRNTFHRTLEYAYANGPVPDELEIQLAQLKKHEASDQRLISELESSQLEIQRQSILIGSLHQNLERTLSDVHAKSQATNKLEAELVHLRDVEAVNHRLAAELKSSQLKVTRQSELIISLLEWTFSENHPKSQVTADPERELAQLKDEEASHRHELESLKLHIAHQFSIITSLREDLERALSNLNAKSLVASDLEKEVARLRDESESNHRTKAELESTRLELTCQIGVNKAFRQNLELARLDASARGQKADNLEKALGQLKKEVEEYEPLVARMTKEMRKLDELSQARADEVVASATETRERAKEVDRVKGEKDHIEATLGRLSLELESAQNVSHERIKELNALRASLESERTAWEEEAGRLRNRAEELEKHISHLEAAAEADEYEASSQRERAVGLEDTQRELDKYHQALSALQKEVAATEAEKQKAAESAAAEANRLRASVEALTKQVEELESEVGKKTAEVEMKTKESDDTGKRMDAELRREVGRLRGEISRQQQEILEKDGAMDAEISLLNDQLKSRKNQIDNANSALASKSAELVKATEELNHARVEIADVNCQREVLQVEKIDLERKVAAVDEQLKLSEREARERSREMEEKERTLLGVQRAKEEAAEALRKAILNLEDAQCALHGRDAELFALRQNVKHAQAETVTQLEEINRLMAKVTDTQKEINRLEREAAAKTSEAESLVKVVNEKARDLEDAQRSLSQRDEEIVALKGELAVTEAEREKKQQAIEVAEKEKNELMSLVRWLRGQVEKLQGEAEAKAKEAEDLEQRRGNELERVKNEVERLKDENAGLQGQRREYEGEVRNKLSKKDEEVTFLGGQLEQQKRQIDVANETLKAKSTELDDANEELRKAKEEIENLRSAEKKAVEDVERRLGFQIDDLTKRYEELLTRKSAEEREKAAREENDDVKSTKLGEAGKAFGIAVKRFGLPKRRDSFMPSETASIADTSDQASVAETTSKTAEKEASVESGRDVDTKSVAESSRFSIRNSSTPKAGWSTVRKFALKNNKQKNTQVTS